ncbi:hypothetical protein PR002_g24230, partial [Phytophthora rubi]
MASATNIESASWPSASSTTNLLYYIEMSPSPPRARRAACVAAVMGGVRLYGVASAMNIADASWTTTSSSANSSSYIKMSPSPPVRAHSCLRRQIDGRSESPRRGERHQHRVRELAVHQQHHKLVVLRRNFTVATPCPPCCLSNHDHGLSESLVASTTNIESASWLSARTAKSSFYVKMSPSPPLGPLLASVAMSMSIVSLHGVASATNTESASWAAPAAPQSRRTTSKSPPDRPPGCLSNHVHGLSESLVASTTIIEAASSTFTSSGANASYYVEMSPSPPWVLKFASVAMSMGGVRLHGVASATNSESECWASASTGTNSSYYVEMSPSPPRVRRAACVAAVMGGVSLHAVASA